MLDSTVSENVNEIAGDLDEAWADPEGISRLWMNPGSDNPVIRDNREALVELLGVVVHGIEMVRDIRLRAFLGETEKTDRPNAAIYRRAGDTFASITANLQGIQSVFENSGMTLVLPEKDREIGYRISEELRGAIALVFAAPTRQFRGALVVRGVTTLGEPIHHFSFGQSVILSICPACGLSVHACLVLEVGQLIGRRLTL